MLTSKFGVSLRRPLVSTCVGRILLTRRLLATANDVAPRAMTQTASPSLADIPVGKEVHELADALCKLDLIETSQLVGLLKKKLNLPDMPLVGAPVMGMAAPAPNIVGATAPAAAAAPEKTEFRVMLEKFDPANKAKVIKEIKTLLPQLNLVEAKAFVESAPKLIKEKVKKDEAEKIKKVLEELGATVVLE